MDSESKMPSKKILSLLILMSALVFSIIIIFGEEKSTKTIESLGNIVSGEKITIPERSDWQSELESLSVSNQSLVQVIGEKTADNNLTDSVSINLISNYLALKQSGGLDNISTQELVDKTFNYISSSVKPSIETRLNITPDNGIRTIEEYGNTLGNILKKNRPINPINEVELIKKIVENNQPKQLKDLDKVVLVYENIAKEMTLMRVPETFTKVHMDIVNSLKGIVVGIKDVQIIFDDPIKGLGGMKVYDENMSLLFTAFKALNLFISQNKIGYKQGTGGYYLLYGI